MISKIKMKKTKENKIKNNMMLILNFQQRL